MIKIIDSDFTLFDEFKNFCSIDSFGTRIYSHFLCYGYEPVFVDFWVQICDRSITCAVCKLEGDFVVCATENTDFEELSAFINFQDKLTLTLDSKFSQLLDIAFDTRHTGDILMYSNKSNLSCDYEIITPQLREYHELLLSCRSDDFFVPDYQHFLSDVSRRQMRDLCKIYGIRVDDTLVSCAMTVSYTDFSVILGAVATHPMHRRHGYAGCIVSSLAESVKDIGNVYIYTTVKRNTKFYESLNFFVCSQWTKFVWGI